ncbi:hypothetical protein O6H91_10G089400 [Diphasiastrum complanatum]|uniref:Uncharacterized protein n=1 Tax=Diphasiastrum complanatum TaxID=34168 RepID=A0ACC2CJC7_DIPCM|nr:hypothetical protein O6H91_10G089400 [Diphasiastrum complanatum]
MVRGIILPLITCLRGLFHSPLTHLNELSVTNCATTCSSISSMSSKQQSFLTFTDVIEKSLVFLIYVGDCDQVMRKNCNNMIETFDYLYLSL